VTGPRTGSELGSVVPLFKRCEWFSPVGSIRMTTAKPIIVHRAGSCW
jgi:hypothetical protein